MITPALFIGTGMALAGAIHQLVTAAVQPATRVSVHLMLAVLCLTVAGFTATSAMAYTASPGMLFAIGKGVVAAGLFCWLALLWFVTLSSQTDRLWIPLALSVLWGGLSLLNLAATGPLLYIDLVPSPPPPFPPPPGLIALPVLGQAWMLLHAVLLATLGYVLWCALRLYRQDRQVEAAYWLTGIALITITTALDLATAAGWLSASYVSPLGWIVLLALVAVPVLSGAAGRQRPQHANAVVREPPTPADTVVQATAVFHVLPHLPAMPSDLPASFRWPVDLAKDRRATEEPVAAAAVVVDRPATTDTPAAAVRTAETPVPPAAKAPPHEPAPTDAELESIIQFSHIALRRIERGKGDPRKFQALFRAILDKAESARDALEHPTARPHAAGCDINAVAQQVIAHAQPSFTEAGIRLGHRLSRQLPPVGIERPIVTRVLRALLTDAFVATRSAGTGKPVVIMTRRTQDGNVELSVTDGGGELSLAEIQGAFESLLKGRHASRGARLIDAAELIAAHGGQLRCTPNPAGGSIRHLRLPVR